MGVSEVRQVYWQLHMHTQLLLQLHQLVAKDPHPDAQRIAQVRARFGPCGPLRSVLHLPALPWHACCFCLVLVYVAHALPPNRRAAAPCRAHVHPFRRLRTRAWHPQHAALPPATSPTHPCCWA